MKSGPAANAERPPSVRSGDVDRDAYVDGPRLARPAARNDVLVDCGHMSGLCVRHGWPLAQMGCADWVPNTAVMSKKHHCVPRVIPILGTDRSPSCCCPCKRQSDDARCGSLVAL